MNRLRWSASGCLLFACLLVGCKKDGGKEGASPAAAGKAADLIVGKWKYEKKDAGKDTVITLDFGKDKVGNQKVDYVWQADGSGPSGSGSYTVVDESTLEIPKVGGGFEEKVKIDSITKDKLVLSGFSYKPGSYEFHRP